MDTLIFLNASNELSAIVGRTIIIFLFAVFTLRIAFRRFNFNSPIDFILPIVIGSVLSRGMNGTSSLVSTLTVGVVLVLLHWLLIKSTYISRLLGKILKGSSIILVKDGEIHYPAMKKHNITQEDLFDELRYQLQNDDLRNIKEARLERTGRISFVTCKKAQ